MKKYETLTETDKNHRMCKLFPILNVAREDIISAYEGHEDENKVKEVEIIVRDLTDNDMKIIAENMYEKMYEKMFEDFWEKLTEEYEDYYYGTVKNISAW